MSVVRRRNIIVTGTCVTAVLFGQHGSVDAAYRAFGVLLTGEQKPIEGGGEPEDQVYVKPVRPLSQEELLAPYVEQLRKMGIVAPKQATNG